MRTQDRGERCIKCWSYSVSLGNLHQLYLKCNTTTTRQQYPAKVVYGLVNTGIHSLSTSVFPPFYLKKLENYNRHWPEDLTTRILDANKVLLISCIWGRFRIHRQWPSWLLGKGVNLQCQVCETEIQLHQQSTSFLTPAHRQCGMTLKLLS